MHCLWCSLIAPLLDNFYRSVRGAKDPGSHQSAPRGVINAVTATGYRCAWTRASQHPSIGIVRPGRPLRAGRSAQVLGALVVALCPSGVSCSLARVSPPSALHRVGLTHRRYRLFHRDWGSDLHEVVTYTIPLGRVDLLLRFLRFFHCFSFWSLENRFTRAARTTPWMPGCWSRYPRGTRKQRWHVSRRPACASCAFSSPGCPPSQSSGPS